MKLLRFGIQGEEKPGCLDSDGNIRDLSSVINQLDCHSYMHETLEKIKKIDISSLPIVAGNPRIGSPISNPQNIIGVGLNYKNHGLLDGNKIPDHPTIFFKHTGSLCGPNDPIVCPIGANMLDYEAEVAIIITKPAYRIAQEQALEYIAGYVILNDVSERDYQNNHGPGLCKGKSSPSFAPLGPYLVTSDEIDDPQNLKIVCRVNDEIMQDNSTSEMIFPIDYLISHISQFMCLLPGDIISTGTPPRVIDPTPKLKRGDIVKINISKLGERTQTVV